VYFPGAADGTVKDTATEPDELVLAVPRTVPLGVAHRSETVWEAKKPVSMALTVPPGGAAPGFRVNSATVTIKPSPLLLLSE
jgi:hypothetical protein